MKTLFALIAVAVLALSSSLAQDPGEAPNREQQDDLLIEAYRTGKKKVHHSYWHIHDNPKQGQRATYSDFDGQEQTYCVAFMRGDVCTVEHRLSGSAVVIAVEFEVGGTLNKIVRRAWIGKAGRKPVRAVSTLPSPDDSAIGLSGGSEEVTREEFSDFKQGGRKWSGVLETRKQWRFDRKNGEPDLVTKTWTSRENWFKEELRIEKQRKGQEPLIWQLIQCSDDGKPLLDWSDLSAPDSDETAEIRKPVLEAVAVARRSEMIRGDLKLGAEAGLHPDAKVGDWAEYDRGKLTLVFLTKDRAVVEYCSTDGLDLCEALEFKVHDGKAGKIVARFAGIKGQEPTSASLMGFRDGRKLEEESGEPTRVNVAGASWTARQVRRSRISIETGQVDEVEESLVSDAAPFGQPLRLHKFRFSRPDYSYQNDLIKFGKDGDSALDWSTWEAWKAPFTAEEVKAFIKVGMRWKYRQEIDIKDEGEKVYIQDWSVTEIDETGYKVSCTVTNPDGTNRELTDHFEWNEYVERIEAISRGTMSERELQLNDRKIRVVLYKGRVLWKSVLFGLSPDLPGVRICTEEDLGGASKVWLTEFHEPPENKE